MELFKYFQKNHENEVSPSEVLGIVNGEMSYRDRPWIARFYVKPAPMVKVDVCVNNQERPVWFMVDTGSDSTLLHMRDADKFKMGDLKVTHRFGKIKTSEVEGSLKFTTDLREVFRIPTDIHFPVDNFNLDVSLLGMDVLGNFNIYINGENKRYVHLKPNLMNSK